MKYDLETLRKQTERLKDMIGDDDTDFDYSLIEDEYGVDILGLEKDMLDYMPKMELPFYKLHEDAISPKYNYDGDSGFDLYSTEEIILNPLGTALVPTGLSFDIKDGYEIQVRSKSGLAINQGIMCLNSPGTVDNSYTGEVKVILFNTNQEPFVVKKGMKIAQAVLCPVVNGKWVNPTQSKEGFNKDRGDRGFGSTGL